MIVILTEDLFSEVNTLPLLAIFQLGMEGRHIIWTKPLRDPSAPSSIDGWLGSLPAPIQKSVEEVLEFGAEEHVAAGTLRIVVGSDSQPQLATGWPQVSLVDGLRLLRTPLTAVLENRRSDRAFLEAITLPEHRPALQKAVANGWLCFESSGGITELAKRLEDQHAQEESPSAPKRDAPLCHLRWWCLCDRDSSEPDDFSKPAKKVEATRKKFQPALPYGPLKRRMIENYLPEAALKLWAEKTNDPDERQRRKAKLAAWAKLPGSLRERFEMKQGFLWGLPKERKSELKNKPLAKITKAELNHALAPQTPEEKTTLEKLHRDKDFLPMLQAGLGDDLSSLFSDEQFQESWLQSEVPHGERFDLIQSILNRL